MIIHTIHTLYIHTYPYTHIYTYTRAGMLYLDMQAHRFEAAAGRSQRTPGSPRQHQGAKTLPLGGQSMLLDSLRPLEAA